MVQRKAKKDLKNMFQKSRKMGNNIMSSTLMLYSVLSLAMVNLFMFVQKQDNESLFLFLVVSALVYTQTTNMITVLLIPLIFVNLLIYLRRALLSRREGFEMDSSMKEFNEWIEKNVDKEEPTDDEEGSEFYEKRVKVVIDIKDITAPTLEDTKHIMSLYTSLSELSKEEPSESTYIKNMVEAFVKKYDNKKKKKKGKREKERAEGTQEVAEETDENTNIQESFTFLENYEDLEDDELDDELDDEFDDEFDDDE